MFTIIICISNLYSTISNLLYKFTLDKKKNKLKRNMPKWSQQLLQGEALYD